MGRKKLTPEEMLESIEKGVDIVGTMLHQDLPRVFEELAGIRAQLAALRSPRGAGSPDPQDEETTLGDIRELLELQERRLAALEARLARTQERPPS